MGPSYIYSDKERTGNQNLIEKFIYALQDTKEEKVETKSVIYEKKLRDAFQHNCDLLD